jgi:hypothetical protein
MLEFSGFVKSRPEVHPHVWYASFLKAQALGRPSFLSLHRPSAIELFPSEFFPDVVLQAASRQQQDFSNIQTQQELSRTKRQLRSQWFPQQAQPQQFQPQPQQIQPQPQQIQSQSQQFQPQPQQVSRQVI